MFPLVASSLPPSKAIFIVTLDGLRRKYSTVVFNEFSHGRNNQLPRPSSSSRSTSTYQFISTKNYNIRLPHALYLTATWLEIDGLRSAQPWLFVNFSSGVLLGTT